MTATERWLPVVGFEGQYEVSDAGRVRSLDRMVAHGRGTAMRRRSGQMLKPGRKPSGHMSVALGKGNSVDVHRIVLEAFVGPCPVGQEGLHGDDDGSNNDLSNLRWGTRADNLQDAIRNGRKAVGSSVYLAKLTEADIPDIRKLFGSRSYASIARQYGVSESTIRQIRDGRSWAHVEAA